MARRNPYSMDTGLRLGPGEVFVKSGSHRARDEIKRRLGGLPQGYYTLFGRKKTGGTSYYVMTEAQFARVKGIGGVTRARILPGEKWDPTVSTMSNPANIQVGDVVRVTPRVARMMRHAAIDVPDDRLGTVEEIRTRKYDGAIRFGLRFPNGRLSGWLGIDDIESTNMNPVFKEHYTKADYPAIFGDSDRDTIEDVDDPHPWDPGDTESIEEVRLADEIEALLESREEFIPVLDAVKSRLKSMKSLGRFKVKGRIKSPFSILNKLRRKRLKTLTDVAGAMMVVSDEKQLRAARKQIEQDFEIIGVEDFYEHPQAGYRAIHYIVRESGHPVELQLKTWRMARISDASHTAYKKGTADPKAMEELTSAAAKADRGDASVAKWLDPLLDNYRDLQRRLARNANPQPRSRIHALAERLVRGC